MEATNYYQIQDTIFFSSSVYKNMSIQVQCLLIVCMDAVGSFLILIFEILNKVPILIFVWLSLDFVMFFFM